MKIPKSNPPRVKKLAQTSSSQSGSGVLKAALTKKFHFLSSTSFSAGTTLDVLTLSAANSGSTLTTDCIAFAQIQDCFRYWRLTSLRVRMYNAETDTGVCFKAICFVANASTSPTTLGQLDGLPFAVGNQSGTVAIYTPPVELEVPRDVLLGIGSWFVTDGDDASDAMFDGPGLMRVISTATSSGSHIFEWFLTCEFASPLDPTMIALTERKRLTNQLVDALPVIQDKRGAMVRLDEVVAFINHTDSEGLPSD